MSHESPESVNEISVLEAKFQAALPSFLQVVQEIKNSTHSHQVKDGISKLEEGIRVIQNRFASITQFGSVVSRYGIASGEGFFNILPKETKFQIFSYLELKDLAKIPQVCTAWSKQRSSDLLEALWKELYHHDFVYSHNNKSSTGVITQLGGSSVQVTSSSVGVGSPKDFIAQSRIANWTKNEKFSWFCVDFGENLTVVPKSYTFQYGSSGSACLPRNWVLQATNEIKPDEEAKHKNDPLKNTAWDTLSIHANDKSINAEWARATFQIPAVKKGYRYFRLLQTGPNSFDPQGGPDTWSNVFVANGFDIFGTIEKKIKKITNKDEEASLLEVKPKERTWEWLYKSNKVVFTAKDTNKNGPGTFVTDAFSYTGDWKDNKKHGYGTYIDKKQDNIYKGWWDADTKHGFGIYVYHAESGGKVKYTGEWDHNQRNGKGRFVWELYGDEYDGEWKNEKKDGKGRFRWAEGDTYDGHYKNDLLDGKGIFTWPDGNKFEGEFKENNVDGQGILTLSDGTTYSGVFKSPKSVPLTWNKREGTSVMLSSLKKWVQKNEATLTKGKV